MRRLSVAVVAALLSGGCSMIGPDKPENYRIDLVAKDDHCRIYRFERLFAVSYYVVCESGAPVRL